MDSGTLSGIVTAIFIAVFVGIVWWAYSKGNKQRFEEDARMPFEESDTPAKKEKNNE